MILFYLWVQFASGQTVSAPAKKIEAPFGAEIVLLKKQNPALGQFVLTCQQREFPPMKEILIRYSLRRGKKKTTQSFLRGKTYNDCGNYKFKLSADLILTMTSPPGERADEPGSVVTATHVWRKAGAEFQEKSRTFYSPFKELQKKYRKILATAAIPKAEKLVIANKEKVQSYVEINPAEGPLLCEDFHSAYKNYAEGLYREKDFKQSFGIFISMKQKFGDPQNMFFDQTEKNNSLGVVCQNENSNNDISEDQFYTFARRYLGRLEFVPFLILRAKRNIQHQTDSSKELGGQMIRFAAFVLKQGDHRYQLDHQLNIIQTWNQLIPGNVAHPDYARLVDEDTHLIFLLAEAGRCADIPSELKKRSELKDDDPETLKAATLTSADEAYDEGLEQTAVFEYKQFVLGRVILNRCNQIPKRIFERYFKFANAQPYEN